jgi:hypothetical protein
MSLVAQNSHKVFSLFAAVLVTFALHGSLLAGFSHLAAQGPAPVFANCNAATLSAVTVVRARS